MTLFYPHIESMIIGGYIPLGDFSGGGWYQTICPYCGDRDPPESPVISVIMPGGGFDYA